MFDDEFAAPHNAFGEQLLFGMRVDTCSVPAEIKRAYRAMAEQVYLEQSETGFLSRRERLAAKEDAEERCRRELADGRYRRSKSVDVLWDLPRGLVLAPLFSDTTVNGLRELFREAFDVRLQPITSGALAYELLNDKGRERDYDDVRPSSFSPRPSIVRTESDFDGVSTGERPVVPWTHISAETNDFLGNEFLLWLWWVCEAGDGAVETAEGAEVLFTIDRTLDMECAWDATGKQSLQADGPGRLPEARKGLQNGKWPRKAGLLIAAGGEQFETAFQADRFHCTGIKLPKPEEDPGSVRELIEWRVDKLTSLDRALTGVYTRFLDERCSARWSGTRDAMAGWIARRGRDDRPESTTHIEVKDDIASRVAGNGVVVHSAG